MYNLGVVNESLGNLDLAYKNYKKANSISLMTDGVNENILKAKRRVLKSISDKKIALKQLQ